MNKITTAKTGGDIKSILSSDNMRRQFALALPKHLTPDRFVRVALTAMTRNPKLAQCDQPSFFAALLTLSQLGLEPDGRLAHLIPFNNRKRGVVECQLIVDYKGLVDLAMRSGNVANIHADKVCDKDVFEFDRGEIKKHTINFRESRGEAYAYYALVRFRDGTEKAEVMTRDEVEAIRKRSRAGGDGPWVTDFDEMAKKTVFRRLSKWIQLSPEFHEALDKEDRFLPTIDAEPVKPNFSLPSKAVKTATVVEAEAEVEPEAQAEETAEIEGEKSPNFRLMEAIAHIGISERKYMQFAREKHQVSGDTINGLSEDDAVNLLDRLEEDSVELETIIASSARRSK